MAERIVSMHAAYKSGKEVVDGFLSRPTVVIRARLSFSFMGYRGLDDGQRAILALDRTATGSMAL